MRWERMVKWPGAELDGASISAVHYPLIQSNRAPEAVGETKPLFLYSSLRHHMLVLRVSCEHTTICDQGLSHFLLFLQSRFQDGAHDIPECNCRRTRWFSHQPFGRSRHVGSPAKSIQLTSLSQEWKERLCCL